MNCVRQLWLVFPIVQIDDERGDVGKTLFDRLPPVDQSIHQAVARHGWHVTPYRKSSSEEGRENAHGCYRRCCFKVMVSGRGSDSTFASPREGTTLSGGFGIRRKP
jgi:hypothetical protein